MLKMRPGKPREMPSKRPIMLRCGLKKRKAGSRSCRRQRKLSNMQQSSEESGKTSKGRRKKLRGLLRTQKLKPLLRLTCGPRRSQS